MESLVGVLRVLVPVLFVGLGATALVLWRRRRDAPAKWAAVSFILLAVVTASGVLLPDAGGALVEGARAVRTAALVCFPYCLHRFAAAFTGFRAWVERLAATATAVLVAATVALFASSVDGSEPGWRGLYVAAAVVVWTALSLLVAVRLWSSGRRQPSVVRRRMRLLGYASVGLSFAILIAGSTRDVAGDWPGLVVQGLVVASTGSFWLGLAPPRFLVASWRQDDEGALNQAVESLVAATSRDQITGVLLPHLVRIVGGRGAALVDDDLGVLATSGEWAGEECERPEDGGSSDRVDVRLRTGRLVLLVSPYTPFFGEAELHRVRSLASLIDLALERICLAEQERQAQQELNRERDFSQRLVRSASDCIMAFDVDYRYTLWNPAMEKITGIPSSEVLGRIAFERFPSIVESGDDALFRAALAGRQVVTEERYFDVPETGVQGWFTAAFSPLLAEDGTVVGGLSVYRDVTPARETEQLRRQALHDPLTGLANRTLFLEQLQSALARLERHPGPVAVMFIDIDRFKHINDRLGHEAGDQVLCTLAARLNETLRPEDTVARLGGDEIAVLCEHVVDGQHAMAIAERIIDACRTPIRLREAELTVTVSIGIALIDDPAADPEQLVARADAAMYRAKHNGRGRAELFDALPVAAGQATGS